jgi:hypothetical protein
MPALISPINATAKLLQYQARGNPPGAHPESAVGNFFPGLEFNFLTVWKRTFIGIELVEWIGLVIGADEDAPPEVKNLVGTFLTHIDVPVDATGNVIEDDSGNPAGGISTFTTVIGPGANPDGTKGPVRVLRDFAPLEWGNLLAGLHARKGGTGEKVVCRFQDATGRNLDVALEVRRLIDDFGRISTEANLPGELTESLCSPWQTDFIGCACYYWAANRPDYINLWDDEQGNHGGGHNWLNEARETRPAPGSGVLKPFYTLVPGKTLEHEDILQNWENKLTFVIGGRDEAPKTP